MLSSASGFRSLLLTAGLLLTLVGCGEASSEGAERAETTGGEAEKIDNTATGALAEMALGNPDATVTVIEYASVTCPHCATFHETIYPTIKENYVDTGKVRYIFREFPTAPAEMSVVGSMLARCAADRGGQDAFFLVLDSLFKTQRTWIYGESPREELVKVASQAGMDEAAFDACVRRSELLELINKNVSEAREKYEVQSTPSFVINGNLRHFSNADDFSQALDEALQKAQG